MRKLSLIYSTLLCGCLLLLCSNNTMAQLKAGFSANSTAGCAPQVIKFTDASTGNPTSWRWDLGNGTISFLQHPAATYFNPGTYTVKLVVYSGSQSDSVVKLNYVTVYALPTVNFTATDTTGCFPFRIQFTDMSTAGDGIISSREWDFGDGTISTEANPEHVYTASGNYSVSLRIKNSHGCTQTFTRTDYIRLNNGVKAGFDFVIPNSCKPPTAVHFTNSSTGTGTLNYRWDFGDGSNSTLASPSHTYTKQGSYTVKLIVKNSTGCTDSVVKVNAITIGTVDAAFTIPSMICSGQSFTAMNNSTPAPSGAYWLFGDGSSSTELNPVKQYTQPGSYTIKLVSDFGLCKDSLSKSIVVQAKASAAFTADDSSNCKAPFTVHLKPATTNAVSYKWLFGDGSSATTGEATHTYQSMGSYDVTLITTNVSGCSDTVVKQGYIVIKKPEVILTGVPQQGCVPYYYKPAFTVSTTDPLADYAWYFGDGSTGTGSNVSHTYTQAGTYTVKLVYMTTDACKDSVVVKDAIKVGNKPVVNFDASPREACVKTRISFFDQSSGGKADQWLWSFGDGGTSTLEAPGHNYNDTGYFHVKLIVWSNGCSDTLEKKRFIYIYPPIARFDINSVDCANKFIRGFTDKSVGASSWSWNFGDGSTSTEQNPVHRYAATGSYIVELTVRNKSCEHMASKQVVIVSEKADFTASDTVACKNVPVALQAVNSNETNLSAYSWLISKDGKIYGTPSGRSFQFSFPDAGVYSVRLEITDIYGCRDTMTKNSYIRVNGPTADFSVLNPEVCSNMTIRFADSSVSDGTYPIQQWIWNYGDGITTTLAQGPFEHTYVKAGNYTVTLKVVDNLGCSDTRIRQQAAIVSKPHVNFSSPDTASCVSKNVLFSNSSTGNSPVYDWNFGDGQHSATMHPKHPYTMEGDYTVKLVVTDQYGCSDSMVKPVYIHIRNPKAAFVMSDSMATCPPLLVNFTNQTQHYAGLEWNFGDGSKSTLENPSHLYTYPGVYRATLKVVSPGGCVDSFVRKITIKGPQGSLSYDAVSGCTPARVRFTAVVNQESNFVWDYNDGGVDETEENTVSHVYSNMGSYLPKMILIDPQGCRVPVTGKDTIHIYGAEASFSVDKQLICDSGLVQFSQKTASNDPVTTYKWSFGDGKTSNQPNPAHYYTAAGRYDTRLVVITQHGCTDTASQVLPLKIVSSPLAAIKGDSASCIPALLQLKGELLRSDTSALSWQWQFGNGTSANVQNPAAVTYADAGAYMAQLIVRNSSGCADTVAKIVNAWPLPSVDAGDNQSICRDKSITLQGRGAATYHWFPATGLSCTDCSSPLASPLTDITYTVTGVSEHGCSARDSVQLQVKQPFLLQTGSGDTLCKGELFRLKASGAETYSWSPSLSMDDSHSDKPMVRPDASVVYQVIGRDKQGCFADTGYVPVVVYNFPVIEAGEDKTIAVGSGIGLNASVSKDVTTIRWTPAVGLSCTDCSTPTASPKQSVTYTLEAVNEGGCTTRDRVSVSVFCNNANVFVPNTFSPNGDGNNDVFYPRGQGVFMIQNFRIFNRWGDVVYEQLNIQANDIAKGWNGMHKGQAAPQDVYIYSMDVVCENNAVMNYKGNVALIR